MVSWNEPTVTRDLLLSQRYTRSANPSLGFIERQSDFFLSYAIPDSSYEPRTR
jgi:hypothetical protein